MGYQKKKVPPPIPHETVPTWNDFKEIEVPLAPIRMEIAQLQKEGTETISLSEFLWMVHRHVKEAKHDQMSMP